MTSSAADPSARPITRPCTIAEYRTALLHVLDVAEALGVTPSCVGVTNFGGLSVQCDTRADLDRLADALNLPVEPTRDEADRDYLSRSGPSPVGLALDVPTNVYGGRS